MHQLCWLAFFPAWETASGIPEPFLVGKPLAWLGLFPSLGKRAAGPSMADGEGDSCLGAEARQPHVRQRQLSGSAPVHPCSRCDRGRRSVERVDLDLAVDARSASAA